jgi:hypothetical protein
MRSSKGHKAKQGEKWIHVRNTKTGEESKKKKKDRKRRKEKRVHINDYAKFSKADQMAKKVASGELSTGGYQPPPRREESEPRSWDAGW